MPHVAQPGVFTPRTSTNVIGQFDVYRGRKPLSGFLMFAREIRENCKSIGSRAPLSELMKLAGREWQMMTKD